MLLKEALRQIDPRLLTTSEGRRAATKHDPLLFAAVYLPHKLYDSSLDETINDATVCAFHIDIVDYAKGWTRPLNIKHKQHDAFISPRNSGKSTWIFNILPIWAGAQAHKRYIIAVSDSSTQSERWLSNFKTEIRTNELLMEDFPEFCDEKRIVGNTRATMDNRYITWRGNEFVFQVAGADNNILGANINGVRPDLVLFDDIEPDASNYSDNEARKRLNTVLSSHWYLNIAATKVFVGTTTMPDSIMDQIRKVGGQKEQYLKEFGSVEGFRDSLEPDYQWVEDNHINCHYYPAIVSNDDGTESSFWEEKYPMEMLNQERGSRDFALNMMNRPVSLDGGYWGDTDIVVYDETTGDVQFKNTIVSVDPAVTTNRRSDYTGLAVLSRGSDGLIYVRHAEQTRAASETLKDRVTDLITKYGAMVVLVETNQGGDLWKQVFSGMPAKFKPIRSREKKEVRISKAYDLYVKRRVVHSGYFASLEEQMYAYPKVPHDDVLDAVATGILFYNGNGRRVRFQQTNYAGLD